MKTVSIFKAQPIPRDHVVEDVTIRIVDEIADTIGSRSELLEHWDQRFEREAVKLEAALRAALPGGTYDRLLGEMLKHKASHFTVHHK
jgi:hypothetical protein